MKLLVFSSYLTIPTLKGFNKNQSGFGYMVASITLGLAKFNELNIDVLTQSNFTKSIRYKNLNFLKRNYSKMLAFLGPKSIHHAFKQRKKYHKAGFNRLLLYRATCNYFKFICKKYDAVHIHGVSPYSFDAIDFCLNNKVKGIVTIHGINYLNTSIGLSSTQIEKEKYYIEKIANSKHLILTVISKGIKKRIIESLGIKAENIKLIPNFHDFKETSTTSSLNIKKKHNIPENSKIILSVGNYSENKNQKQLLEIFYLLNDPTTYILFIGTGINNLKLKKSKENIILCEHLPKDELRSYYLQSNILAVTSISEGFGLPMIESLFFGLPVITFSDIDAIEDINENSNLVLVKNRSSKQFAENLKNCLSTKWDKKSLKRSVDKFASEIIIKQYYDLIKNSIELK